MKTRYAQFVQENTPVPVVLTEDQVQKLAQLLGGQIVPVSEIPFYKNEKGFAIVGWGPKKFFHPREPEWYMAYREGNPVVVDWSKTEKPTELSFEPVIWNFSGVRAGFDRTTITKLGFEAVSFEFPEPVVDLPIPEWVGVWSEDWNAGLTVERMFLSEARKAASKFIEELQKAVQ